MKVITTDRLTSKQIRVAVKKMRMYKTINATIWQYIIIKRSRPMQKRYERILKFSCDLGLDWLTTQILGPRHCDESWWAEITEEYECAYEAVLGELVNGKE